MLKIMCNADQKLNVKSIVAESVAEKKNPLCFKSLFAVFANNAWRASEEYCKEFGLNELV